MPRLASLTVLLLLAAAPAVAGWLVTRDGEVVPTRGDWRVDGSVVVFTTEDGRLSSLRARDVDLEASRARSTAPPPSDAPATAPETTKGPVMVLTDDDVGHVRTARASDPAGDEEVESPQSAVEAPAAAAASRLEVLSWQDRLDVESNTLYVVGSVANRGEGIATSAQVDVRLLDDTGAVLERRSARLQESVLRPGAVARFTATFPGSPGYSTVEFEAQSRGFKLRSVATPAEAAESN